MFRVYGCITEQHNLWLVLLAAVVCLLACYTTFSLSGRVGSRSRLSGYTWLVTAATVTGSGVWATHFIAMLAFKPGLPMNYDIGITALSVVIAIMFSGGGYALARLRGGAVGGALVGLGVGAMHFTGMAALEAPALKHWDSVYVAVSLAIGIGFGSLVVAVAQRRKDFRGRISATGLLAIGIVGLHFTAMAAFSMEPDPRIAVAGGLRAPQWLAIAIAAVTFMIVALGLVGATVDEHLAGRSAREAARLRRHIEELEATKQELEMTTRHLRTALSDAAAASQAKSQFLATMSHELRTPLNAIIGFAEMQTREMFGPLGDERYRNYAQEIFGSGQHLLGLINDILDVARLDVGKVDLNEEPVDLAETVRECARMVERQAETAAVVLSVDLPGDLPWLRADKLRLRQVLLNLLANAIKFTPEGGKVAVSAAGTTDALVVAIADTGIGMAANDIATALERFGQIDSRISRNYEGAGLGLPLAKSLVDMHGGTLEIESAVGVGTTVTVRFPRDRVIGAIRAA